MSKILVVFYSRTGRTKAIGQQIAAACGSPMELISDKTDRSGLLGYIRSALQAFAHAESVIRHTKCKPSNFDIVVIGSPIWFWNIASPVRAYIRRNRKNFKKVAFFCTCGGSGQAKVLRDMARLCGQQPISTLSVTVGEMQRQLHRNRLGQFALTLKNETNDS